MWDYIAKTQCGSELAINELLEANQDYKDTVIFSSGVTLTIPDYEAPTTSTLPPWRS